MKYIKKYSKSIGFVVICLFCCYITNLAANYAFNLKSDGSSINLGDTPSVPFTHVAAYNQMKTIIGSGTLNTDSQDVIGAVNEVKADSESHYEMLGSADEPITNLNNIPLNTMGMVVLDVSINPSGYTRAFSYWKCGTSASTHYTILAIDQYDFKMYIYDMYDSTSNGWKLMSDTFDAKGGTLATGTNLNNVLESGVYFVSTSNTYTNVPEGNKGGILVVMSPYYSNTYQRQIYYYGAVYTYTRTRSNSSGTAWQAWYRRSGTKIT